ncbi:hypothetical protein BDV19DRAFT_8186 [Aspergillus venezuelensis]
MNRLVVPSPPVPGWISPSEWVSKWHQGDPEAKIAHTSKLVDEASITYDSGDDLPFDDFQAQSQASRSARAFHELKMLSDGDSRVFEQWLPIAERRRQRKFEHIMARRKERARETGQPMPRKLRHKMGESAVGIVYKDIPLTCPNDLTFMTEKPKFLGPPPSYYSLFENACRGGSVATIESDLPLEDYALTPAFFHHGLCLALKAGNVEAARFCLDYGAPIIRRTTDHIRESPENRQVHLFELLSNYGWTPNTPGEWGAVILPQIVHNHRLLQWFLAHGANPNLGSQHTNRYGESVTNSCAALERAAYRGDVEAVRMLLDAGALIENGFPLHAAAEASQYEGYQGIARKNSSEEFDSRIISVMALLVEHGADVNQIRGAQMGNMVTPLPILCALFGNAVERVRWLLEQGANPIGSRAAEIALKSGGEEMKAVFREWQASREGKDDEGAKIEL